MINLQFEELKSLLQQNLNKKYVDECLFTTAHKDLIFHPGTKLSKDRVVGLYSIRLDNSKTLKLLSDQENHDLENCINNMQVSLSPEIGLTNICIDNISYEIFYDPNLKNIYGIVRLINDKTLKDQEEMRTQWISNGASTQSFKYSKGTFVRDWK